MNYVKLQGAEGNETVVMSNAKWTDSLKYHDITLAKKDFGP